jgi:hypothetical protein
MKPTDSKNILSVGQKKNHKFVIRWKINPMDGEIPNGKKKIPKPRMIMIRGWFGIWGLRIENYLGFGI